jgi:hypothetical protein
MRAGRRPLLVAALAAAAVACGDAVDNGALDSALAARQPAEVTVQGRVSRLLADSPDRGDGVHQRFDLDIDGNTVEIDHNLSLAGRVPVAEGGVAVVHGQFEPDPGRPVIHYTHHATGRHEGGWIEVKGTRYE